MTRKTKLKWAALAGGLVSWWSVMSGVALAEAARPDLIFILADDLGWADVGCYGGKTPTPHIDRLAREGLRFTQFYANGPECSPTRTAFLTGRYQQRVGGLECAIGNGNVGRYDDAIRLREKNELGLPVQETSLARLLKDAGYRTVIAGKWHLGYEPKFFPGPHGFDHWFGPIGGGADYFHHVEPEGLAVLHLNGAPVKRDGYMTDLITAEAVRQIHLRRSEPLFLYAAYTAPHTPIQGPNDRRDQPVTPEDWNKGTPEAYAAMIRRLDDGVGEILRALETRGLTNALVVFTSDNGGTKMANNGPLAGNKGTLFEGGIRVPCIARWPGILPAGAVSEQVGITMDWTVSFARLAQTRPPAGRPFDGLDLLEKAVAGKPPEPRTLFWRARRGEVTWRAMRAGSLKLVSKQTGVKVEEHLFDLERDLSEKNDLVSQRPDDVLRLKERLAHWENEVKPVR